jgi:endonuclease YncB( thermonuclease family)
MALSRSLARPPHALGFAAVTFALGLAAGATIKPVISGPSVPPSPAPPPARAAAAVAAPAQTVQITRVIDGDTFEARIHLWPGLDVTTRVRLRGIDAPELKARCPEERAKAEAARNALASILDQGGVTVAQVSNDKYGGRVLATAGTRQTPDVSAAMLAKGFARPYAGGHRGTWCGA